MPRECLAHVKYKDGHAHIGVCSLREGGLFSFAEMRKWLMEDDSEVVDVSVSKVPDHLKAAVKNALDSNA